jgi:hypothetical protein
MVCCLLSASVSAVTFNAFADVVFGDSDRAGEISGFELGRLDLWGTHIIDEERKLKAFIELVVESEDDEFIIDLERLWVEYAIDPKFKIRAGRFHTALGYWNRVFHHGAHMQVSVGRPLFLGFEDKDTAMLPSHTVGVMAVKDFEPAVGKLRVELQIGNGTHIHVNELNPSISGDEDNDKAIVARLFFSPRFIDGLGLGISYLSQEISFKDDVGNISDLVDQNILVADVSYIANKTEIFLEYYVIENEDTAGITHTSTAWYAQGTYTFSEKWTPYLRYEFSKDIDPNDPYFITLLTSEYSQTVVGVRYDINYNSSIKLEGRSLDEPSLIDSSSSSIWAQWTFAF